MRKDLYRIKTSGKDQETGEKKSIHIYFDSLTDAKEYARAHNIEQITQFLADMECVETYEFETKKIERKVIELTWDWYPRGVK